MHRRRRLRRLVALALGTRRPLRVRIVALKDVLELGLQVREVLHVSVRVAICPAQLAGRPQSLVGHQSVRRGIFLRRQLER